MTTAQLTDLPLLPYSAAEIIHAVCAEDRGVMLFGPPGTGKSTLAAELARTLHATNRQCWCLGADPGSPAFGVPGAVTLARWNEDDWQIENFAALCTLDAGRFRLPLVAAVQRLVQRFPEFIERHLAGTTPQPSESHRHAGASRQPSAPHRHAGASRHPVQTDTARRADLFGGVFLLDAPGVVRGMAGRELLEGLIDAAQINTVLVLSAADRPPPLLNELLSFIPSPAGTNPPGADLVERSSPEGGQAGMPVNKGEGVRECMNIFLIHSPAAAKRPGKRARARQRTAKWNKYLKDAVQHRIDINNLHILGTPPPPDEPNAWAGRQVAFLDHHKTTALGEVDHLNGGQLSVRLPKGAATTNTLLIRDAVRTAEGLLETAAPFKTEPLVYLPPADVTPAPEQSGGPRVFGRVGHVDFSLLNGVFGDPLLHLRLRHLGRSLLFDLGDGVRLPARLAHQVTDVFISHAHMDHISGFPWLLRSRLTGLPPCRVYGPPGIAQNIEGFIQGFLWDRIGDSGPLFLIAELHGDHLRRFQIRPGGAISASPEAEAVSGGVLHTDKGFRIRAVLLDHRTPVLAYALELEQEINVRKDRLLAMQLEPGPWLTQLKQALMAGNREANIKLPDGTVQSAGALGEELVLINPGKKLVYATDLADTEENRQRLTTLARNAHTFICEAPFIEADADQAHRTGHLTAHACGEIAAAANVARLVPFHFSRRYSDNPQQLYEEINAACTCLAAPKNQDTLTID